jgi:hypothetical protein
MDACVWGETGGSTPLRSYSPHMYAKQIIDRKRGYHIRPAHMYVYVYVCIRKASRPPFSVGVPTAASVYVLGEVMQLRYLHRSLGNCTNACICVRGNCTNACICVRRSCANQAFAQVPRHLHKHMGNCANCAFAQVPRHLHKRMGNCANYTCVYSDEPLRPDGPLRRARVAIRRWHKANPASG